MLKTSLSKTFACLAIGMSLALSGCKSTSSGSGYSGSVGPSMSAPKALGSAQATYAYNKNVYLDVAIPVIDPGFPMKNGYMDHDEIVDQNIWPEVRRLESKRFSINMRDAIAKTKAFGSVRVVPTPGAAGDLYIISRINESDTLNTSIGITVVDATNKVWGEKDFKVAASEGFYRDTKNQGKDPNQNLYTDIANYVYQLVQKKKADDLENIKLVADMRYAAMYSPEAFSQYLVEKRDGFGGDKVITLNGLPADADVMLNRVREYEAQDMAFIDGLQMSYDTFFAETEEAYRTYQKESLPLRVKANEEKAERNTKIGLGILAAGAAILLGKNSNSTAGEVGAVVSGVLAVGAIQGAMRDNEALKEYNAVFDEVGQNLDLKVSPQVRAFEDKEIELQGTASEQYNQWRSHLIAVYKENETPSTQL